MPLSAPLNVLARNVGNGNLELAWQAPAAGTVHHYDIFLSTTLGGVYAKANHVPVTGRVFTIYNIPFGTTNFTKVCAEDAAGVSHTLSDAADDATCDRAAVELEFTGPLGDEIADDALFAARCNGSLLGWAIPVGGTLA